MALRETREEKVAQNRPKRIPVFEANRNKITVSGLDQVNFMNRWVNDTDDRLSAFLDGGWSFVDKHGKEVGDGDVESTKGLGTALSRNMGRGVIAYLMRIPMNLWLEDQAKKRDEQLTAHKETIRRSANKGADYGSVKIEIKDSN